MLGKRACCSMVRDGTRSTGGSTTILSSSSSSSFLPIRSLLARTTSAASTQTDRLCVCLPSCLSVCLSVYAVADHTQDALGIIDSLLPGSGRHATPPRPPPPPPSIFSATSCNPPQRATADCNERPLQPSGKCARLAALPRTGAPRQ